MPGIRISGGRHKGRRIAVAGDGRTRYTSAKVRQAVFDLIGDIQGFTVLDLFAGAGSFTIEALSRNAASVTAVEKDRRTAAVLRSNLKALSLDKDCLVFNMDVRYAVPMLHKQGKRFDIIFVDPPYEMGYSAYALDLLRENPVCHGRSVLVFEHSKREGPGVSPGEGHEVRTRRYGDTVLTVLGCGGHGPQEMR
ncbi:MAG: 16S rRNA (guanine(966)-N(2))-methyltransferase RsmD [Syntrophorhabdales bacterium]|jgi:16S rRNA (guanine(966)-N(2))-methyltransferase RsmD